MVFKGVVNWWIGRVTHSEPDESEEGLIDNDYIPLAAALIDADVIEEARIIPENYFLYFEDVEFSQEVKNLNRDVYTDLATTVLHGALLVAAVRLVLYFPIIFSGIIFYSKEI